VLVQAPVRPNLQSHCSREIHHHQSHHTRHELDYFGNVSLDVIKLIHLYLEAASIDPGQYRPPLRILPQFSATGLACPESR